MTDSELALNLAALFEQLAENLRALAGDPEIPLEKPEPFVTWPRRGYVERTSTPDD